MHAQLGSERITGLLCGLQPYSASACVGYARVDDQRAYLWLAGRQVLAAKLHGCGAVAVLGENAAHATACIKQKHSEVFAVGFAHACFNNANAHTIYGQ